MPGLGRSLIYVGAGLLLLGVAMTLLGRSGLPLGRLPLGRLPGDINLRGRNVSFHFPVVTCLLFSALLSLLLWLAARLRQ